MAGFEVDQELLRALARAYDTTADGIAAIRPRPAEVAGALPGSLAGKAADPAPDRARDAFGTVARRHQDLASLVRGTDGRYTESEDRVVGGLKRLAPPAAVHGPWSPR